MGARWVGDDHPGEAGPPHERSGDWLPDRDPAEGLEPVLPPTERAEVVDPSLARRPARRSGVRDGVIDIHPSTLAAGPRERAHRTSGQQRVNHPAWSLVASTAVI